MTGAEKILVAQTSFLGDVVLTIPLIAALRRRFPGALLAVLCTPQGKAILQGHPDIDEIIVLEKKRDGGRHANLWKKAAELKARRFTIAVSPHKSLRTALLLCLAGIPLRIGFRQSAGWFLYHHRVERDASRHDVERNLSLVEALGIDPVECPRELRIEATRASQEKIQRLFDELGIVRGGLIVGVNPGSIWPTKRWTIEGYAGVCAELKARHGAQIVLFGGPEDREIIDCIMERANCGAVSLAGRIGLSDLAAAMERCRVFVTNDSGPMHVAVATGVPVVAIFCATTPSLGFYPYSSRAVVVEKQLACRPCGTHGGRRCPLGTDDCMRLVRPEDVLIGVERLLAGGGERAPETNQPVSITV
ncbi:MAG TPA: lipopolysaccharide heptosyltransferase II [Verrucomicrobiae bacterium]|jgi:heptosyltransferase-2|nr:lipopolysaccharide heptosyltransferase II [Verrucomicrobiae bacterium]